jgi:signal peptidase I
MTELNLDPNLGRMNHVAENVKKPTPRWLRVTIAFVLSALFPGLGQLYNRQPRKGLIMAVSLLLVVLLEGALHSFRTFPGFIVHLLLFFGGAVLILIHACRTAWNGGREEVSFKRPRITFVIFAVVIICLASLPAFDWFRNKFLYIKAFRVSAASMCPTICEEERMVADMAAYKRGTPQRGDVIMMKHATSDALFIKRVIGVGGDVVSAKPGEILVNGQPLARPEPSSGCRSASTHFSPNEELPVFDSVKVPPSSYSVIGDNWPNSYDSRIEGFGFVTPSQVRGKPVYIYWSPNSLRIGCPIR